MAKKVIFKKFNGTGELSYHLAQAVVQEPFREKCERHGSYSSDSSYERWAHTRTYEEANELLLYGCKELQRKIEKAGVEQMRLTLNSYKNRRHIVSGIVGFAANVPAYLAGTPNSMINVKQTRVRQRVLSFMYNTSVADYVTAERIIKAAANVVSAIMIVEASGIRVNVWAGEVSTESGTDCLWMCKVKEAGQRMDTLKMSYPLAHPSMLRRQWFRLLETTEGVPENFVCGYGAIVKDELSCMKILKNAGVNNIQRSLCFSEVDGKTPREIAKMLVEGVK